MIENLKKLSVYMILSISICLLSGCGSSPSATPASAASSFTRMQTRTTVKKSAPANVLTRTRAS